MFDIRQELEFRISNNCNQVIVEYHDEIINLSNPGYVERTDYFFKNSNHGEAEYLQINVLKISQTSARLC